MCTHEVGFRGLLESAGGGGADEEGAHVVGGVGVGVDVLEAVGGGCHVLVGVVVADEVHDCRNVSMQPPSQDGEMGRKGDDIP